MFHNLDEIIGGEKVANEASEFEIRLIRRDQRVGWTIECVDCVADREHEERGYSSIEGRFDNCPN